MKNLIKRLFAWLEEYFARRDGIQNYECDVDTGISYITDGHGKRIYRVGLHRPHLVAEELRKA